MMGSHNITEIVGDLTKAELVAIVLANTLKANIRKQTWPQIMDVVRKLPDHILDMIHQAAEKKDEEREVEHEEKAERKRITNKLRHEAQKSVEEVNFEEHNDGVNEHDYSKYLGLPSEEEIKKCFKAYISGTSNEALATSVCIVCARELMSSEGV